MIMQYNCAIPKIQRRFIKVSIEHVRRVIWPITDTDMIKIIFFYTVRISLNCM